MAQQTLEREVFAQGHYLFREGDSGERAYLVQTGMVEIVRNVDGKEKIIGTITQGGIFGEMALIDDKPRMASARAAEATTVIVVSGTQFKQKLAKTDPFIRGLLNILANTVRSMCK